MSQRSQRGWVQ